MPSTVSTAKRLFLGDLVPKNLNEWSAGVATTMLPEGLERRVAEAIGAMWDAPLPRVVLEWGWIRDIDQLGDQTEYRLVGDGTDCWFAVVFEQHDRPSAATRMRAGLLTPVAYATRALESGTTIIADDFVVTHEPRWGPPRNNGVLNVEAGWTVETRIEAGRVIAEPAARPQPVIRTGETVKLTWRRGTVTVCLEGVSLHDAARGQQVEVCLKGRRGNLCGTVTGAGAVRLAS